MGGTTFVLEYMSSGTATELWQIILGRVVSGAGGAGMTSMIAVIITDVATPSEVAVLRSYINVVAVTGRSAGGPIGGILTDTVGWRWSFLGQSILALLLCGLIAVLLPSEIKRKEDDASQMVDNNVKPAKKKRSVDYPGLILFAAMLTGFLLTLDFAGQGVSIKATAMIVTLVLFAASTIAFFLTEIYFVEKPLIPFSLLRNKGLGVQLLIQILLLNSQFSILSNLGTYFVRTENASNSIAALHIVPVAIGNAIGALIAGRVIKRTKRYKGISIAALAFCSLGYLVIALRWHGHINIWESLYVFGTSFGVGAVNSAQFVSLSAAAPKDRMATAVSLFFLSQQVGMMIGASSSSSLLQYVFEMKLSEGLEGVGPDKETVSILHFLEGKNVWSLCSSATIQPFVIALKEQVIE
ncbi:MAG: hypothetical protein MMC33_000933 [Icmadophila ericetorum]|nr:hypothetical protein [Icmadophila ericetorum]